jgi:hypothetical protein
MVAKINATEGQGTPAKNGLFWRKTINQITRPP